MTQAGGTAVGRGSSGMAPVAVGGLTALYGALAALHGLLLAGSPRAEGLYRPVVHLGVSGQLHRSRVQLTVTTVLAVLLHAVRARRERRLHAGRDELAVSERRFRSIYVASPVGIGLVDEDGCFVAANAALCQLMGRPESELLGSTSVPFTHPDDQHVRAAEQLSAAADGVARVEKRYLRPDGEVRWAWITVTRTDSPGGRPWTLAHVQDVTERRAAEQALRDSEGDLAAVAQVARRIRNGEDARTGIVEAVRALALAGSVALIEPETTGNRDRLADGPTTAGAHLVVTAAAGADLVGTRIPLALTSATAQVFRTGQRLFRADPHLDPLVSPALLDLTGARSVLLQPVVAAGVTTAVIATLWNERVTAVSDRRASAVALLADETAIALEHERLLARLEHLAGTDPLTGLANRRSWNEALPGLLAAARRDGRPLTMAIADLDHFKAYNDVHGHLAGDALLTGAAAAYGACLRDSDLLARWGGEEFAIALPDCPAQHARSVLDRLRRSTPQGQTCSIGFAVWDTVESPAELLGRADAALYAAKATGRDRVTRSTAS